MREESFSEGQLIAGKYRVERVLGSGAMGVVVAAWHEDLAQRVAVKIVRAETVARKDSAERFRREARAAARLRGEHIVRVIDVGTLEDQTPFMVMEFLEGNDLAQELERRGPLPVAEATRYLLEVVEAVAEAHAAGIVHRDLKPANLFLSSQPDGSRTIKVLDFGVSKTVNEQPGSVLLTQEFAFIGSPLYMSPEQMRSAHDVDAGTDIWALGVILFELLSGQPPFVSDSIAGLVRAQLESKIELRAKRPELSPDLEAIVRTCLAYERRARYADVAELGAVLVPFAPEHRVHAERARRVLTPRGTSDSNAAILAPTPAQALAVASSPGEQPVTLGPAAASNPTGSAFTPWYRRGRLRLALLIGAALVGLGWLGERLGSAPNVGVPPSTSATSQVVTRAARGASDDALTEPVVSPIGSRDVAPVERPSAAPRRRGTVSSGSAAGRPIAGAASLVPRNQGASPSSPSKATRDDVPEFGGRR